MAGSVCARTSDAATGETLVWMKSPMTLRTR